MSFLSFPSLCRGFLLSLVLLPLLKGGSPALLDQQENLQPVLQTPGSAFVFVQGEAGIQYAVKGLVRNVLFYDPSIVRVITTLGPVHTQQHSLAVIAHPLPRSFGVEETSASLTLRSSALVVRIDKASGALSFLAPDGRVLTRERAPEAADLREYTVSGDQTYEARHAFTLFPDESLYGLGQYNESYMDYRGQEVLLVQTNIGSVVPFLLSTRRYGILWDMYSKMRFKDTPEGASLWAESAPAGLDYYFVQGATMDGVIAGYRKLTGAAPLFPRAALGLFMSKERYKTQARVEEVVRRFRSEQFPLDYIVQDWQYWGGGVWGGEWDGKWSGMIWNQERFPDPAGLTRRLHEELHAKLMVSIWPSVGNDTDLAHELDAKGLRFEPLHWISKKARIYDAFSAEGRAIYFKHAKKGLLDVGVDALWMDGTEVEVGGACHDPAEVERDIKSLGRNALGDFTRYLNAYSLMTTQGVYEGQRASSNQRVFTLTRSAWAGQQRYAALPWSGDTRASWRTLHEQIAGGLNMGMAGLPYWSQDTGGFFVSFPGREQNPEYQELFARWNQFAVFNPIYRIHGTNIEREPYVFKQQAPAVYASLLEAAQLRYRLLPYLYSLAWQTTSQGYTLMRGLALDFPDELALRKIDDCFLFGPAFLVHPVTHALEHLGTPAAETIPSAVLRTAEGQVGLAVHYYSDEDLRQSAGSSVDQTLEHSWPGPPLANPPPGLQGFDHFSADWQGVLVAPESGDYELGLEYSDGARLWVNGRCVLEDWAPAKKRYRGVTVHLEKGQSVPLCAEFHHATEERFLRLCWRSPAQLRSLALQREDAALQSITTTLPAGASWYDFWTDELVAGGQSLRRPCPLNRFPLFVRAGSLVPMGPVQQYSSELPAAPYQILIYSGADAQFTIYEDDGETYAYERGERATYVLSWKEATHTLSVGVREGSFPGLIKARDLECILISTPEKAGEASTRRSQTVHYEGQPLQVRF